MVKGLPAIQETQVQSLGQEDPLEKEMQPASVFLPGKSHRQNSLAGYSPWGCKESDTTEQLVLNVLQEDSEWSGTVVGEGVEMVLIVMCKSEKQ